MATFKPIDQQVMVITGATSGIGLTTAEMAAQRGARLVLAGRTEDVLRDICDRIRTAGGEAVPVTADVADRAQVERIADAAINAFSRIDTWVNNAGVSLFGLVEETSEADARRLFDTNFWGVVNGSLVALPHLRASGGTLINLGSEVSEYVVPLQGMYSATKHAVKGFTDVLRVELDAQHAPVSVTLIQPTAVNTPFAERARNYLAEEPKLPDPKIEPQQVAEAIFDAATHARRDVKVGWMSRVNTALSHLAPSIADHLGKKAIAGQKRPEPARHVQGTLHAPGRAGYRHGTVGVPPISR